MDDYIRFHKPIVYTMMLTGTRNIMALILLSGCLFANWNYHNEGYTQDAAKIETDFFKYGLIYYSTSSTDFRIDIVPPANSRLVRQSFERKLIVKTRRTGNKFYHQVYKNPVSDNMLERTAISTIPATLINPGKITLPFSPRLFP
jgi:hypothetical protein